MNPTTVTTAPRNADTGALGRDDERGGHRSPAEQIVQRIVAEQHDRPSLVATIASRIGAEIIEGRMKAGDDLNSVELSRRFNTSRTPTREALILLEKEGLVDVPPRRRPRVKSFAPEEIRDIYEARAALFAITAQAVATNGTEAEIAGLAAILSQLRRHHKRNDGHAFLWANVEFFDRVTLLARNRTVRTILDTLLLRTLPLRRLSLSLPGRRSASLDDTARLVRAFEQRDADLAAALIRSNHLHALKALMAHLAARERGEVDEPLSTEDGRPETA